MGSISATSSIDRVTEKHGEKIRQKYEEQIPEALRDIFDQVTLENNTYSIRVTWVFKDGSTLEGPEIDIDNLADDYPDCDIGY